MYGEVDTAALWKVTTTTNDLGEEEEVKEKVDSFPSRISRLSAERRYESSRETGVVEDRLYVDYDKVDAEIERADHKIEYPEESTGSENADYPDDEENIFNIESVNNVDDLDRRYQIDLLRTD